MIVAMQANSYLAYIFKKKERKGYFAVGNSKECKKRALLRGHPGLAPGGRCLFTDQVSKKEKVRRAGQV